MDLQEKIYEALLGVQQELRLSREQREQQQHVHIHAPRVSFDTVLLSIASAAITGAIFVACSHG